MGELGSAPDREMSDAAPVVVDRPPQRVIAVWKGGEEFDTSKPDGTPRKLLDVSRLFALGWQPSIDLRRGLAETYAWFQQNVDVGRGLPVNV